MDILADSNWLIRLDREFRGGIKGPARRLMSSAKVFYNPVSKAEFLTTRQGDGPRKILAYLHKIKTGIDYEDAEKAAHLRLLRSKQGKALSTPDALIAASALRYKLRLVTADKDFSGIPGLDWSSYREG